MNKKDFFIHESSYIDEDVKIGSGTKIWHFSHILSGANLGKNCHLGQNVVIGNNVKIGNFVKIQNNVSVYEGVELEDYVFCGPSMVFTNIKLPRSEFPQRGSQFYKKTLIKKSASIGANATNYEACEKIFKIKNRSPVNPLIAVSYTHLTLPTKRIV